MAFASGAFEMAIAILYRDELTEYGFGPGHPFRGDRYPLFWNLLRSKLPEDDNYRVIRADPATDEDLRLICTKDYIDFTRRYFEAAHLGPASAGDFYRFHSGDNLPVGRPGKLEEAARLIVGQAKSACDLVEGGVFKKAVSIGGGLHHAKRSYGEGFCLYNDVAFCALYLMKQYGLQRVLILDTDAHAGNGTSQYFYEDPRVLLIDLHQDPNTVYPGTGFVGEIGSGKGEGFTVNVPLPAGADDLCYKLVFDSIVEPLAREFKPEIIVRNGGSDPAAGDELTTLALSVKGFQMIGERVNHIATVCDGRVIDLIASGYNMEILPYAWLALITGLAGIDIELGEPQPIRVSGSTYAMAETQKVIGQVRDRLKRYWESLS